MARVEILAGRERRRFWSAQQKLAIVEEAATSGLSMAAVARRHDIVPQQIYGWQRQLGLNEPTTMTATFLPVVVAASEEPAPGLRTSNMAPIHNGNSGRIEIRCINGRVLNIEPGLDAEMLKGLIRSVEGA